MTPVVDGGGCPFPGLRPFEPSDSDLFFGREEQVYELLTMLRRYRFVAVLGSAGSGRASLLRAGVLPALADGFMMSGSGEWRIADMRPGAGSPVARLADAISDPVFGWGLDAKPGEVQSDLGAGGPMLVNAAKLSAAPPGTRFLLIVERFEQVLGFVSRERGGQEEDDARYFVRLLLQAATSNEPQIYVIVSMRAEFLGHLSLFPGLVESVNRSVFVVPSLTRDQLRRSIEAPFSTRGVAVDPQAVDRILNDAGRANNPLPRLGHFLSALWTTWYDSVEATEFDRGQPPPVSIAHVEATGGIDVALRNHLDSLYDDLRPEDQVLAGRVFRSLVQTDRDGNRVRAVKTLERLSRTTRAPPEMLRKTLSAFLEASVLVETPSVDGDTLAQWEVVHEVVFYAWPRYEHWLDEGAEDTRLLAELHMQALRWADDPSAADALPTGRRLEDFERWRVERAPWSVALQGEPLDPSVAAFLDAALAREERARRLRQIVVWGVPIGASLAVLLRVLMA